MSGKQKTVQHGMQGVFVFVLLGLFAVMSTLMVLIGAQMYRNTVDRTTLNNEDRVLDAYVRSMIRAGDLAGSVKIENHDGVKALAMYDNEDGDEYVTWLYCYEGYLYEQYTSRNDDFVAASGTAICPAKAFAPKIEGELLTVQLMNEAGELSAVQVALHGVQ